MSERGFCNRLKTRTFVLPFLELEISTTQETLKFSKVVTKADVIAEIAEKTGIDKADVTQTLESFFTVVKDTLASEENIYVRGFGSFINKKRAKKVARNISKNTAMVIDEHFIPSFKPAKVFVEQVKGKVKSEGKVEHHVD